MKKFLIITVLLCLTITAIVIRANLQKAPPPSAPVAEITAASSPAQPAIPAVRPESPRAIPENTNRHVPHSVAKTVNSGDAAGATVFGRAIDTLVSPTTSFQDKQAAWVKLRESEQLDQAIDTLRQGATNNPASPQYAAALGQALLQKAGVVSRNGGSMNELGILGMSADQSFDNALKIDPANWDAQFYKAVSMSYWPAELNKGSEVVQRLSDLINQQETMPAQPEFSLPYIRLGDQYQKLGQTDNALQTWQAGAARFPNDTTLQKKLTSQ